MLFAKIVTMCLKLISIYQIIFFRIGTMLCYGYVTRGVFLTQNVIDLAQ